MPDLLEIANFLDQQLEVDRYFYLNDPNGIYYPTSLPIRRIGLALEPDSKLVEWIHQTHLDALFLHRPWMIEQTQVPSELGILAYHLAFDEHLTLGFNPNLANALGMTELEVLGTKDNRPIGMIGNCPHQELEDFCNSLNRLFSDLESTAIAPKTISRVAIVGAMTADLVHEAAARGANVYVTGQFRHPAATAVQATGISVISIGHHRCEQQGLNTLAQILHDRWSDLEVILFPPHTLLSSQNPS